MPPEGWSFNCKSTHTDIWKVGFRNSSITQPVVIITCVCIFENLSWRLFVHGRAVNASNCVALALTLDVASTAELLSLIDILNIYIGNPEHKFVQLCELNGDELKAADGTIASFKDGNFPVMYEGETFQSTVRSTKCSILTEDIKCEVCKGYRATLHALCNHQQRTIKDTISKRKKCPATQITTISLLSNVR